MLPAAGRATRLGDAITGSKEVVDVGGRPATVHLLERLAAGGIDRALIALRRGKWDVPEALTGPRLHGVDVGYVMVDTTPSPAHTIAPALRLVPDDIIALAFPDVLFEPPDAFARLVAAQATEDADVVLGLLPPRAPERVDMVELDDDGQPAHIVIKQPDRGLRYSWTLAVWSPRFSRLLLEQVTEFDRSPADHELQIGEAVQAAIDGELTVRAVAFPDGSYIDIGTPADLARARRTAGEH